MRKNLLALTAALLGFTAAQAAEPVTITIDSSADFLKEGVGSCTSNTYTLYHDGNAALQIKGQFESRDNNSCLTLAPGNNASAWVSYSIEGTDSYKLVSFSIEVGSYGDDNIYIKQNGTEQITTDGVTITSTTFEARPTENAYKKGLLKSATFVLEPLPDGDVIKFTSADALDNGTLTGTTYITDTTPAAQISGYFANESNVLCISPMGSGKDKATYTISAEDPESYDVAYFKLVFVRHGDDDITIYYNGKTETTSATNKVTIEGYADQNDPMTFEAETTVAYNWKKCEIESAIIILVPRVDDGEYKPVTFDNTDADRKGDLVDNKVYTTKSVPRITIAGTGMDIMSGTKLALAPGARLKTDEQIAEWSEYTIAPVNTEKYRLKSCVMEVTGFGDDNIRIYYNDVFKSTDEGTVTISYPVDTPATVADEATDEVTTDDDPVVKFKATTIGSDGGSKKGEIVSATFVLEPKDNVTTGLETITGVMNSEGEVIWYDLRGRRVENPANGIYVNSKGKKHLFAN